MRVHLWQMISVTCYLNDPTIRLTTLHTTEIWSPQRFPSGRQGLEYEISYKIRVQQQWSLSLPLQQRLASIIMYHLISVKNSSFNDLVTLSLRNKTTVGSILHPHTQFTAVVYKDKIKQYSRAPENWLPAAARRPSKSTVWIITQYHPQNRKYTTYCNSSTGWPSHGHGHICFETKSAINLT